MTVSREEHYVVHIEVTKVTNYFETTAHGSGSRPSGYQHKELDKHRQSQTVINFTAAQPELGLALELTAAQVQLLGRHNELTKQRKVVSDGSTLPETRSA